MRELTILTLVCAALLGCGLSWVGQATATSPASPLAEEAAVFAADGRLLRPKGYRSWVFVGAPVTPNDMNGGRAPFPEFHGVYVDPDAFAHWKRTGEWRSGTVMVKELSSVGAKVATSGEGYFMGDFRGLEVSVKHPKRFPDAPGGWAYFRFTDEAGGPPHATAEALPDSACASCHASSARDDLVFTQYYPVLRAAKKFGTGNPEDG